MQQRGVDLLHFNMLLLLIRTSAPLLLLLLSVSAEAGGAVTCGQEIRVELIRDLWERSRQLITSLPKEEKFCRRLLPQFCTACPERSIGWLEMQEVIDVYQRSVFSTKAVQKLLPLHYNELLHTLQHTLHHCVSSSKPSKRFKTIKKLERNIKKKRNKQALKAVREFTFILRWMDELRQRGVL